VRTRMKASDGPDVMAVATFVHPMVEIRNFAASSLADASALDARMGSEVNPPATLEET